MTYKITNITHLLNKRDVDYNRELTINYQENMTNKSIIVRPKQIVFFKIDNLPLTIHKLRVMGLISVVEVSDNELNSEYEKKRKIINSSKITSNVKKTTNKRKSSTSTTKKKTTNKRKSSTPTSKKKDYIESDGLNDNG